jgi:hypothetical protein
MDSRLLIATRIHHLLIRYLGDGIDISAMLKRDDYAREVMFVCEASGDEALRLLARQFREAPRIDPALAKRPIAEAAPPQEAAWAADTSGFGAPHQVESDLRGDRVAATPSRRSSARWYKPSTWFGDLTEA